jgi:hypothetical protein
MSGDSKNRNLDISLYNPMYGNDLDVKKLDSIPSNVDMFGQISSLDGYTLNEDYFVIYTSYDKNKKGVLKLSKYGQKPKVIVALE